MRLKEEEDAIAAEYAELQQQMANLETAQRGHEEPDEEERQIQMMMSTVEKEHDAEMLTHKNKDNQKLEKIKKSRRKSEERSVVYVLSICILHTLSKCTLSYPY